MKQTLILFSILLLISCQESKKTETEKVLKVTSSDIALNEAFQWAQSMALSYVGDSTDQVGPWYEASLPERFAFCMRDVSHQSQGAEILDLSRENLNMFSKFIKNISEDKDWCTYWEINKFDLPAPVDYRNEKEFWYNLNANFDLLDACYRTYLWTGDLRYIKDPAFLFFYEKTMTDYIERWQLQADKIMDRPRFMNEPHPFDPNDSFHTCRGLPSYVENFEGLTVSADLIASIYRACISYSMILRLHNEQEKADKYAKDAEIYADLLNSQWWDQDKNLFNTFMTENKEFHKGEGETFLLWFGVINDQERIKNTVNHLLSSDWNVENLSYFPRILYSLNYNQKAYEKLISLQSIKRNEYPEVSYGVIEGIICGLAGIKADASHQKIVTLPHLTPQTEWIEIENIPVFSGNITIKHEGTNLSIFENNTGKTIIWKAAFPGSHQTININGKDMEATTETDILGNTLSFVETDIKTNEKLTAKVK